MKPIGAVLDAYLSILDMLWVVGTVKKAERAYRKLRGEVTSRVRKSVFRFNPLNAELNPICHLLALLGGATVVVVSRLRVKRRIKSHLPFASITRRCNYSSR